MMTFLLYTLVFMLAIAGFTLMLYISIQRGNWLGRWQNVLRKWDIEGKELLYRIGGACQLCSSHAVAQLSFPIYLVFCLVTGIWPLGIWCSVIWYGVYISLSTNINLFFITKLYK